MERLPARSWGPRWQTHSHPVEAALLAVWSFFTSHLLPVLPSIRQKVEGQGSMPSPRAASWDTEQVGKVKEHIWRSKHVRHSHWAPCVQVSARHQAHRILQPREHH